MAITISGVLPICLAGPDIATKKRRSAIAQDMNNTRSDGTNPDRGTYQ
jgi:hypothetical protein